MDAQVHRVFVTGGTGYVGRPLITQLLERGHEVRALVRPGSERKLPAGCEAILGDALDGKSFASKIAPADTFRATGRGLTSHSGESRRVPQHRSGLRPQRRRVRKSAGVEHFVYVSVAHPAPVMKTYIEVRSQCEDMIRQSGMNATILRPWYVLGPGHRWPYLLITYLQADGIVAVHPRRRHPPGTGHAGPDGSSPGRGG